MEVALAQPKHKQWSISLALVLNQVLAVAPLMIVVMLFATSWRAQAVLGYWPEPMNPDPKSIQSDLLYTMLLYSVYVIWFLAQISIVAFPALLLLFRRRYHPFQIVVLMAIFIGGWLLFRADPGLRFYWFVD
ncbi:MAG: hypothetical protein ABIQ44_08500 [Chloroflexia bacterium]